MQRISDSLYDALKRYSRARISKSAPALNDVECIRKAVSENQFAAMLQSKYRLACQLEQAQRADVTSPGFLNKFAGAASEVQKEYEPTENKVAEDEIRKMFKTAERELPGSFDHDTVDRLVKSIVEIEVFSQRYLPSRRALAEIPIEKGKYGPSAADQIDQLAQDLVFKSSKPMDLSVARAEIRKRRPDLAAKERQSYADQTFSPHGRR